MNRLDYIKYFDILSPKPSLVVNKNERFQTIYGGLLSILLVIISLVAFGWFFALLYQKSDFVVISNNSFNTTLNYTFQSQDRLFMFNALTNRGLKIPNQERIFKISASNMNYTFSKNSTGGIISTFSSRPLKVVPCNENIVRKYLSYLTEIDYTLFYCLDQNQTIYLENTPQSTNFFYYLNVYYSPCVNSTQNNNSCLDNDTITNTMKIFHNQVVIMNTYFDHNNQTAPEQLYATSTYDPSALAFYSQKYFYFQRYNYVSDDGFVLPNPKNSFNLTFSDSYYAISQVSSSTNIPYAFLVNVFQLQPISVNYNRSYKKAQSVVAEIGGFINALFLISGIVTSYLSTNELQFHIFRNSIRLIDPKKIKKGKYEKVCDEMFKSMPRVYDNLNNQVNEELKIQVESESDERNDTQKKSPIILRKSRINHSANFIQFSVIRRIITEDQMKMNFFDYFLSTCFSCYRRNDHLRDYYSFIEKKVLKLLDISQIIKIQNKLKYVEKTLFPDESFAMNILSEVLFYNSNNKEFKEEDELSNLKMNFNENFEKYLNNFKRKLDN